MYNYCWFFVVLFNLLFFPSYLYLFVWLACRRYCLVSSTKRKRRRQADREQLIHQHFADVEQECRISITSSMDTDLHSDISVSIEHWDQRALDMQSTHIFAISQPAVLCDHICPRVSFCHAVPDPDGRAARQYCYGCLTLRNRSLPATQLLQIRATTRTRGSCSSRNRNRLYSCAKRISTSTTNTSLRYACCSRSVCCS